MANKGSVSVGLPNTTHPSSCSEGGGVLNSGHRITPRQCRVPIHLDCHIYIQCGARASGVVALPQHLRPCYRVAVRYVVVLPALRFGGDVAQGLHYGRATPTGATTMTRPVAQKSRRAALACSAALAPQWTDDLTPRTLHPARLRVTAGRTTVSRWTEEDATPYWR